jgi:acyl-CoA synthetase (AMP-forming)/AMP-acid ligase II
MNIIDRITEHAHSSPNHLAIIDGDREFTYQEIHEQILLWGGALQARSFKEGDLIGVGLKDKAEFVIAWFAIAAIGAIMVPVDWRAPRLEKIRTAKKFDIAILFVDRPNPPLEDIELIPINEQWHTEVANAAPATVSQDDSLYAQILLSSGTTGEQSGALQTHTDVASRFLRNVDFHAPISGHRYFSALPLCFSGGISYATYQMLAGNTLILFPPMFSVDEYVAAVKKYAATWLFAVPTVLRWLLELPEQDDLLLPTLRKLTIGTAPVSEDEKMAVVQRICPNLYEVYASAGAGQIAGLPPEHMEAHGGSVGIPNPDLELQLVDDNDQLVPTGTTGRLRCRGPGVSYRYYETGGQELTSEDRWCYTGDLAELDDDGFLYVRGRADHVINRGGTNIYPDVVERALLQHAAVQEVAVVGISSPQLGEEVVAFVVSDQTIEAGILQAHCRGLLAPNMIPGEIRFLPSLPKSTTGKVRKGELIDSLSSQHD